MIKKKIANMSSYRNIRCLFYDFNNDIRCPNNCLFIDIFCNYHIGHNKEVYILFHKSKIIDTIKYYLNKNEETSSYEIKQKHVYIIYDILYHNLHFCYSHPYFLLSCYKKLTSLYMDIDLKKIITYKNMFPDDIILEIYKYFNEDTSNIIKFQKFIDDNKKKLHQLTNDNKDDNIISTNISQNVIKNFYLIEL